MTTDPRDTREPVPDPSGAATERLTTAHPDVAHPRGEAGSASATVDGRAELPADADRLFPADRAADYGRRWDQVKGSFVDEPREAVAQADALVGQLLDDLQRLFREQRSRIEAGLDAEGASTEDLRLALRRYRTFFDRLLVL